jgi:hypothetical protein
MPLPTLELAIASCLFKLGGAFCTTAALWSRVIERGDLFMREFPQLGREICWGLNVFIKSLALAPMIEVPMRKFAV